MVSVDPKHRAYLLTAWARACVLVSVCMVGVGWGCAGDICQAEAETIFFIFLSLTDNAKKEEKRKRKKERKSLDEVKEDVTEVKRRSTNRRDRRWLK